MEPNRETLKKKLMVGEKRSCPHIKCQLSFWVHCSTESSRTDSIQCCPWGLDSVICGFWASNSCSAPDELALASSLILLGLNFLTSKVRVGWRLATKILPSVAWLMWLSSLCVKSSDSENGTELCYGEGGFAFICFWFALSSLVTPRYWLLDSQPSLSSTKCYLG